MSRLNFATKPPQLDLVDPKNSSACYLKDCQRGFVSERNRLYLTDEQVKRMTEDLGYEKNGADCFVAGMGDEVKDCAAAELKSLLRLANYDGRSFGFPINKVVVFSHRRRASEPDTNLPDHKAATDRVVTGIDAVGDMIVISLPWGSSRISKLNKITNHYYDRP